MRTITETSARDIMTAMAYTLCRAIGTWCNPDDYNADWVNAITRELFQDFCNDQGIDSVEEDPDEDDINDDVDESNYDPFSGCDVDESYDLSYIFPYGGEDY